jgi:hypothetical protein
MKSRIKKLIEQNKKADPNLVNDGLESIRKLRRMGIRGRGYNLIPPFSNRGSVKPVLPRTIGMASADSEPDEQGCG